MERKNSPAPCGIRTHKLSDWQAGTLTVALQQSSPLSCFLLHNKILSLIFRFWLEILRPGFLSLLESRDSAIVRAAFCDCLSEIGDDVIARIPTEKRNLCVTYLLRQCRDDDHRVVASAFRGIGVIVTLPACQSDSAFLVRILLSGLMITFAPQMV